MAFSRLAATLGVVVRPGPLASPDGGFRDHIRIAYGSEPDRLVDGVERLAAAWAAYTPATPLEPPVAGRQRLTKEPTFVRVPAGSPPTGLDFPAVADLPAGSPQPPRPSARSARRPRFVLPDDHAR